MEVFLGLTTFLFFVCTLGVIFLFFYLLGSPPSELSKLEYGEGTTYRALLFFFIIFLSGFLIPLSYLLENPYFGIFT